MKEYAVVCGEEYDEYNGSGAVKLVRLPISDMAGKIWSDLKAREVCRWMTVQCPRVVVIQKPQ